MKRLPVHGAFAMLALALALLAAAQGWRLEQALRMAREIGQARASGAQRPASETARLAYALTLARANYDASATALKELTTAADAQVRRDALYDLANLHLRAALKNGAEEAVRSLPLIELAKQNYRQVLHEDPADWDARYNLERALWLAPEFDIGADDIERPNGPRERAATTMQSSQGDLP